MKVQTLVAVGWLGAITAAAATEPAPVTVMEEVVVTAKHPFPEVLEEVVVTVRAPGNLDAAGDAEQRAVDLDADLRSRLRGYAHAAPPRLHF